MTGQPQPSENKTSLNERLDVNFALQAAGLGVWGFDPITNLVNYDDRCNELFGLTKSNVLTYEQVIAHVHPDDAERVEQAIAWALRVESGGTYDVTYRTIRANDGRVRWVRFWGQSSFNQTGQAYRFAGVSQDVTESVLNRQQVEESQRRFRVMIEEVPIATSLLVGRELIVEVANTRQLTHWGKGQQVLGQPLVQVLPELRDQPFLSILDDVFSRGVTYRNQQARAQLCINGSTDTYYFDVTYTPLFNKAGEVYAILTISTNITESVLARQTLEEKTHLLEQQEQQWRTLAENTPDAITRWDQQRRLTFANAAFARKTGLAIPELLGKTNVEMDQPPAVAIPYMDRLQTVLDTGQPQEHYNSFPSPKGETYYHSRLVPEVDTAGSTVGVLAIARDITALKASEEQFRSLIEEAPVATCLFVGRELIVEVANEPMLAFWGKGRTVFGKPLAEAVPELRGQPFLQILDNVFTTGTRYETRNARAELDVDGVLGTYYFDFTYEPLRNAAGEVYAIMDMAVDVTQQVLSRKAIEDSEARYRRLSEELESRVQQRTQELMLANQDLKRSNDNLQQFAYIASHDLQEPLRKIQSFSSLLNDQYGDQLGESGRDFLGRMAAAGGRMSTLIKDLLAYSRISTRQQIYGEVSLEAIVASVLNTLEWDIEQRRAQVSVAPLPLVRGDQSQLDQLFQNLISNALKFTPAGQTPEIRITSRECNRRELPAEIRPTSDSPSFYQISVRDGGIGFDTKYLDRIFQVFQRLHGKSNYPGTGVGLAICQRVVENHGGGITANSKPGEGATFCIYLPV